MLVASLNRHGGNNKSIPSDSETWMTPGKRKGERARGRRTLKEDEEGRQKELAVDERGQGHSCDEELRMKDVALVRP